MKKIEDDKIFAEDVKEEKKEPKKTRKNLSVITISDEQSRIFSNYYSQDTLLKEIEDRIKNTFKDVKGAVYDFKVVGTSEGYKWVMAIASDYYSSSKGDIALPEAYLDAYIIAKNHPSYSFVVVSKGSTTHFFIINQEPLFYKSIEYPVKQLSPIIFVEHLKDLLEIFKKVSYPAVEIENLYVVGGIPVEILNSSELKSFISSVSKETIYSYDEYDGLLNLKKPYYKRITLKNLLLMFPYFGRQIITYSVAFLLGIILYLPLNTSLNWIKAGIVGYNQKMQTQIEEIKKEKEKFSNTIKEIEKNTELVLSWKKAVQSIPEYDWQAILNLIFTDPQNKIQSFGYGGNTINLVVETQSSQALDSFLKKLATSDYVSSISAPERRSGSFTFNVTINLKEKK